MDRINPTNLYAPLRHRADFDMTWPLNDTEVKRIASCTGSCQQGRKPCASPQACELYDDEDERVDGIQAGVFLYPALMALALFCILVGVHVWRAWQ